MADPVSAEYESLDLAEPVAINGQPIETEHAPIVLDIEAGYYLSELVPSGLKGGGWAPGSGGPPAHGLPPVANFPGSATGSAETESSPSWRSRRGTSSCCRACGAATSELSGKFFGKAPAAVVDLKAVVKYLHHNRRHVPGDTGHIIAMGNSAGARTRRCSGCPEAARCSRRI